MRNRSRVVGGAMAAVAVLAAVGCSRDHTPILEVSSEITAAIATAALGEDVTVTVVPGESIVDAELLANLAPVAFGEGPQWVASPPVEPDTPTRGSPDPAVWLDPDRVVQAARLLADRVVLDDAARQRTDERLRALGESMRLADEQVQSQMLAMPAGAQTVRTRNMRLAYFAERYGLRVQPLATDDATPDPMEGLDVDRLGPAGSPAATLDGLIIEVGLRVTSAAR